jgi:hypothetical protein
MNDSIFRSVEFWKSALLTMPDNSFFELLRSVFGKIKTPFNKQQLLKDLEIFLLREDIQKTIAAYIDENDSKIIAAVSLFGEAVPGDLEDSFFRRIQFRTASGYYRKHGRKIYFVPLYRRKKTGSASLWFRRKQICT